MSYFLIYSKKWVLCNHGLARPQLAAEREGLQIRIISWEYIEDSQQEAVVNFVGSGAG
jgi:hypothetical protein